MAYGRFGKPRRFGPRQMFPAICADCGAECVGSPSSQPKEGPFTTATAGRNGDIEEAREFVIKT